MADMPQYQMFINGQPVDGARQYELRNPATGEVFATVAQGGIAEVDQAVAAAKASFDSGVWRRTPVAERARVIRAAGRLLAVRAGELTELLAREIGVPARLAGAFHVGLPLSYLDNFANRLLDYRFEQRGPALEPVPATGLVRREPIGVCAAVVAWNIPLLLAVWKIVPALATGNSVVIKPDEKAPLSVIALVDAFANAGLPAGVLNLVTGDGEDAGAHLVAHPDVRKVAFTGSTAVGKSIMRAAADGLKRITLELGGKGANIVLPDADLDAAVDGALFACMANTGQACEAGTRLLVHSSIHDRFVEQLVHRAAAIRLGDPMDPETDLGPVVSGEQFDRVLGYIEQGREEGATVVFGGGRPEGAAFAAGHWVLPTIFDGVHNDMRIAREEIFGPVLSVLTFDTDDEAVRIANDNEYGLAAGVWSRDTARAAAIAERLEVGVVYVNDWHVFSHHYPFGGRKNSGIGRESGPDAFDDYTEVKTVSIAYEPRLAGKLFTLALPAR